MGRSTDNSLEAAHSAPKAPSLLARFKASYTPKKRNFSEYYIEPLEPYRQYSPGDAVKGSVVVNVIRALRVTHLTICLHGFVKVFQNAKIPGESISNEGRRSDTSRGTGKRGSEYFGNGFASLFENEIALCGEGRLDVGKYVFHFELDFPSQGLPSSIDFERGTISYLLTSTLTRPTTISPTVRCDRKLALVETIDIAPLSQPRPRVISLEPVSRKPKSKFGTKKIGPSKRNVKGISVLIPQQHGYTTNNESVISQVTDEPLRSPALSEHGSVGGRSSGTSSSLTGSPPHSGGTGGVHRRDSINSDACGTITAMIEPSYAGCLPGDVLPLKISVDHTKPVKAMQGIIVTLFRQGRVDTSPTIPLGPSIRGQKQDYEYYPKSLTGLGGLSLSSAGSSKLFRQDLNQTFTPLIIDPRSLTAILKTSIQVPEHVFPTISSTPGAMISFSYYLEVVIDLRGKPITQDRFIPRLGMVNVVPGHGQGDPTINGVDGITNSATSGFCSLDTSQMRREKGVVSSVFEVIVGTKDSNRKRLRQKENTQDPKVGQKATPSNVEVNRNEDLAAGVRRENSAVGSDGPENCPPTTVDGVQDAVNGTTYSRLVMIPPPMIEDEQDEKTRLKRAEERLLPSSPPNSDEPSSSAYVQIRPSAPAAFENDSFVTRTGLSQLNAPEYDGASAPSFATVAPSNVSWYRHAYPTSGPIFSHAGPQDDKQELERQRLQMSASSPYDAPEDATPEPGSPQNHRIEPTAPVLEDDHPYQYYGRSEPSTSAAQTEHVVSNEHLPVYKK